MNEESNTENNIDENNSNNISRSSCGGSNDCKKNYFLFTDDEFPPTKKSLFINGNKIKLLNLLHSKENNLEIFIQGLKKVHHWLRPPDVVVYKRDKNFELSLLNRASPTDVIQGELGSCWFIAALASLTLKPDLITSFILPASLNPSGYYQVRLCRRGEWISVNIDDLLPCDKKNQLLFTLGNRRQFGFPLIEKALAKMYGSYEAIAKGGCAEGLQTLTGAPSEVIYMKMVDSRSKQSVGSQTWNHMSSCAIMSQFVMSYDLICETAGGDKDKIWQKIMYSKDMGFLMTCLCYHIKLFFDFFEKNGLFNLHIYSILDAREIEYSGNTLRLLKLRNPWGQKEWKGDWSQNYNWPDEVKDQINDENSIDKRFKSNGCFWMSFEDFHKHFYDITISKIRADWSDSRYSSFFYDYSIQAEVYKITIANEGIHDFEIELFATGRKNQMFDRNDSVEIDLCLVICKMNNSTNELTCVGFEHNVEYYINLSAKLEPATYIIFATSLKAVSLLVNDDEFDHPNYYTYNIVFHCQSSFNVSKTFLRSEIVADLFYSVSLISDRIKYELNEDVRKIVISRSCCHGILIENLSKNYAVKISLDISNSRNVESSRMHKKTEDFLNPCQKQVIAFLTPDNYRRRFLISYNVNTEYTQIFPENQFPNKPAINELFKGLHAIKSTSS